jgi:hypothetical protein
MTLYGYLLNGYEVWMYGGVTAIHVGDEWLTMRYTHGENDAVNRMVWERSR